VFVLDESELVEDEPVVVVGVVEVDGFEEQTGRAAVGAGAVYGDALGDREMEGAVALDEVG
jgi:hypothetical protein